MLAGFSARDRISIGMNSSGGLEFGLSLIRL
jgi:hypothetical protein